MDKCPEYNFVGTTMSRPLCEKPELPTAGEEAEGNRGSYRERE